ncbi:CxC2 domain-containing protein [Mycena indigotica]|uniref:CxC2 domain-containing protein n=1 Tax=Mycena indigotica TaxID=2126181 RepID=A0A8H6S641_9AGAR|nr:CxC2 domain-containing protein [Mycena indigotica]KAF7293092.1 CxC2 domain-containing protein [Mycena indigotica]
MQPRRGRSTRPFLDLDVGRIVQNHTIIHTRDTFLGPGGFSHHGGSTVHFVKRPRMEVEGDSFATFQPMPSTESTTTLEQDDLGDEEVEGSTGQKRKQYVSSSNPMSQWRPMKGLFLDEILRHEGLGNDLGNPVCAHCQTAFHPGSPSGPRFFRCEDCGPHLQCLDCCLAVHERFPLHSFQEWNGNFWTACSLNQLGYIYQVGHGGFSCPLPDGVVHSLTIVDLPYIHTLRIRYGNCSRSRHATKVSQLLRNLWYPATVIEPATCITFRSLKAFRLFNVVGNLNVTDFITSLERMTNSLAVSGLVSIPERSRQFQRISRQWSFLQRCKRSGRGHDPADLDATPLGTCAVNCWACPHDGRNLPVNWKSADPRLQFLYMLILAMDANFRLKNRIRANEINDPPLGPGWAYWVEPSAYQAHVQKYVSETDMSTCTAFAALLQKDTRMTTGLRVSGVGGCVCARHECVRPNGLGDLQKGERYCNMDWILFSAIMGWKLHLRERMARLPTEMRVDLDTITVQFGLPVWHQESHKGDCKENNSLSYKSGVAKTDGEGVERVWSGLNPAALATKEMGLGNRADVLDDRIDNHNFLKNMTLGNTLQRRLVVARNERGRQVNAFQVVNDGIDAELQRTWKRQVREWEQDNTRPNPYVLPTQGFPSEAEIRLELQQEERQHNIDGRAFIAGGSATSFLSAGLQIEDSQFRIHEFKREHVVLTADHQAKLEEIRGAVLRKIARFRELQHVYMPGAAAVIAESELRRDSDAAPPSPEDIPLFMPSQMPKGPANVVIGCIVALPEIEERLRVAQCQNSLSQLRFKLHSKRWLVAYRNANLTGQHQTTKAVKLLQTVTERANSIASRYRRGYLALQLLGCLSKYPALRELKDEHIRLPGDEEASDIEARKKLASIGPSRGARIPRHLTSKSRRVMSWIWTAPGAFDNEEEQLHTSMKVEWARAFARKTRWNEEVMLLEEEMRRVLRYLEWEAKWWREQSQRRENLEAELSAGLHAYALKSAAERERVLGHFRLKWQANEKSVLNELETLASIASLEE